MKELFSIYTVLIKLAVLIIFAILLLHICAGLILREVEVWGEGVSSIDSEKIVSIF